MCFVKMFVCFWFDLGLGMVKIGVLWVFASEFFAFVLGFGFGVHAFWFRVCVCIYVFGYFLLLDPLLIVFLCFDLFRNRSMFIICF